MMSVTLLTPCTRRGSRPLQVCSMLALAAALAVAPTSLLAGAQIQGSPDAVRIETQNSSIEEVLTALGSAFDLRYRSSANLGKQLSGTYEGSLQRVVTRVLEGYDFILRNNKGRIEITVLGTRNAAPGAALASTASTPAKVATNSPSSPALPAPAASTALERPAPVPAPAGQRSGEIKVAEAPAAASDPTKVAGLNSAPAMPAGLTPTPAAADGASIVPAPMPSSGSAPTPEPVATGMAAVPMPIPDSGAAPFPEPVTGGADVPVPAANSGSTPIPAPGPAMAPQMSVPPTSPAESQAPTPQ